MISNQHKLLILEQDQNKVFFQTLSSLKIASLTLESLPNLMTLAESDFFDGIVFKLENADQSLRNQLKQRSLLGACVIGIASEKLNTVNFSSMYFPGCDLIIPQRQFAENPFELIGFFVKNAFKKKESLRAFTEIRHAKHTIANRLAVLLAQVSKMERKLVGEDTANPDHPIDKMRKEIDRINAAIKVLSEATETYSKGI